jgi:hypothetical protein
VNRAIDSAAARKSAVGCVDDGVDFLRRDVAEH